MYVFCVYFDCPKKMNFLFTSAPLALLSLFSLIYLKKWDWGLQRKKWVIHFLLRLEYLNLNFPHAVNKRTYSFHSRKRSLCWLNVSVFLVLIVRVWRLNNKDTNQNTWLSIKKSVGSFWNGWTALGIFNTTRNNIFFVVVSHQPS